MDPCQLTLAQAADRLRHQTLSSVELTRHFLDRIDRLDTTLGAYITVDREGALRAAEQADQQLARNAGGPLTGIPVAHKDLFCTQGVRTTCGSRILSNFTPPYDATVTRKLKEAGAVILGKTNMDEFAMGSSTESSHFGVTRNPWDVNRIPGGSSGGSAAAVAADLCIAATGTDTGGSIRQPAALTGITGIKPTYGRVSRFGMIAFASSLDQGGPLTKSVADAALMLEVMCGHDAMDATSIPEPAPRFSQMLNPDLKGKRIGMPSEFLTSGLQPEVAQAINAARATLVELGAEIQEISLPHTPYAVPTYYIIAPAEASSNLARYDGVRYGYRCADPQDLTDLYTRSRAEGFGAEVKRRIMLGTYVLSSGYYDAYYRKAQKVRRLIADDFKRAFANVDAVLTPTTPTTAFKLGEKTDDPVQMYLSDIFTISVNLAGLPGLVLPCGFDAQGLPIGMQLIGRALDEITLLNIGHAYQQATDWHTRRPQL